MRATTVRVESGSSPGAGTSTQSVVWWLLAGVIVLAVAVRLAGVDARLTIDDAYSWFAASSPSSHVFLQRLADNENTPPLVYLVLMLMPGSSPFWLRMPALFPGVISSVVLFLALRRRFGDRPALIAGLAVAVAPYLVTYADLARGFMLADLALLVALWCLLGQAEVERWWRWGVFVAAGVVSVYTEYRSAIVVIAMVLSAVWLAAPRRRCTVAAGVLVLVSLVAWVPEIVRSQGQVGVTKFDPLSATPSLSGLRDLFDALAFGENEGTSSAVGRWLLFLTIVALAAAGYSVLRRSWSSLTLPARYAIQMLAGTTVVTVVGFGLAAVVGIDIYTQRYLTILVPLLAGLGAAVLMVVPWRWLPPAVTTVLVVLGVGNFVRRLGGEWQPSLTPVRLAADRLHPRTVLTNTPAVLYYLPTFQPVFDRPYNLGPGDTATCVRPCLVIDDTRVHGGTPRIASGSRSPIGPFLLVYEP